MKYVFKCLLFSSMICMMNFSKIEGKAENNRITIEEPSRTIDLNNDLDIDKIEMLEREAEEKNEESIPERRLNLTSNKKKRNKKKKRSLYENNIDILKAELGLDTEKMEDRVDKFLNENYSSIYDKMKVYLEDHNKFLIKNQKFVREYKSLKTKLENNK